ncbi:MAG: CPBP family intramembrane metalloprotease [Clostridia bacterium]|nr:CPBP family intramembrane metalloprotease [Clostridia bacterium]
MEINESSYTYAPSPDSLPCYIAPGSPSPFYPVAPADPAADKRIKAKSAYKRTGWYMVILYMVMSTVSSLMLALSVIPAVMSALLGGEYDWILEELADGNIVGYYSGIMKMIQEIMYSGSIWIVLGIVSGSVFGMLGGILLAKLVLRRIEYNPPEKKKLGFGSFLFYAIAALGMWGIGVYAGNIPPLFGLSSSSDGVGQLIGDNVLPYVLYAVIGAPFFEELAMRKLLLDRLRSFGEAPAALVTALLFGLLHGNSGQFFLAFNVGLIFAVVYLKTGRVIYTMALHALINFFGSIDSILYLFGITEIGGMETGYITFILCAAFAVIGLVFMIVTRRNEKYRLELSDIADMNGCIFKNPAMVLVVIYSMVTIIAMDVISLFNNLMIGKGALSLLCFIPTAIFIPTMIVILKVTGSKQKAEAPAPAENA